MSVPRWFPPFLAAVALGMAGCGGSSGEGTDALQAVEASTTATTAGAGQSATSAPTGPTTPSSGASGQPVSTAEDASPTDGSPAADTSTSASSTPATAPTTPASTTTEPATTASSSTTTAATGPPTVAIRLRLDRRVDDEATAGFAAFVQDVLTDQRGWSQAGFQFSFDDADFDYTVVLAEGSEVDSLCLPYDTFGRFSCQIGPVVALNADRWRTAVESWPAGLDAYRTMLVNHEVGHLLGNHHPATRCPGDGQPAPVMAQQSSGVAPCTANPWPLPWEIACAAAGLEPLAPPYERNITLTCGPDGPTS